MAPQSEASGVWWRCPQCQFEVLWENKSRYNAKYYHLKLVHETKDNYETQKSQVLSLIPKRIPKAQEVLYARWATKLTANSDGRDRVTLMLSLLLGEKVVRSVSRRFICAKFADWKSLVMLLFDMVAAKQNTNLLLSKSAKLFGVNAKSGLVTHLV